MNTKKHVPSNDDEEYPLPEERFDLHRDNDCKEILSEIPPEIKEKILSLAGKMTKRIRL